MATCSRPCSPAAPIATPRSGTRPLASLSPGSWRAAAPFPMRRLLKAGASLSSGRWRRRPIGLELRWSGMSPSVVAHLPRPGYLRWPPTLEAAALNKESLPENVDHKFAPLDTESAPPKEQRQARFYEWLQEFPGTRPDSPFRPQASEAYFQTLVKQSEFALLDESGAPPPPPRPPPWRDVASPVSLIRALPVMASACYPPST